jgi:hypothetical protein
MVVAFSVNVKLVENIVKSHDGRVNVENPSTQYRRPGMTLKTNRIELPMTPIQERWEVTVVTTAASIVVAGTSVSRVVACDALPKLRSGLVVSMVGFKNHQACEVGGGVSQIQ